MRQEDVAVERTSLISWHSPEQAQSRRSSVLHDGLVVAEYFEGASILVYSVFMIRKRRRTESWRGEWQGREKVHADWGRYLCPRETSERSRLRE